MTLPFFAGYAVLFLCCGVVVYLYRRLYREIQNSKREWWNEV